MTNWIISVLIVTVCIQLAIIRFYRLRNADLRRELSEATDWMDPIVIEGELGKDEDP